MPISRLSQIGCKFLGSRFAIMGGAMSWVSNHSLVAAISDAGGFGVIACGAMSPDMLQSEIRLTKKLTDQPFGVNLILMHPNFDQLLKVCIDSNTSHIVLAGGMPSGTLIKSIKEYGIKVMSFASSIAAAKRLISSGIDALIIEGMEAGGHIGPVSTSVLAQEIIPYLRNVIKSDIPIFIAGGIGRGEVIANYLILGASGCQLGTLFVCATESIAHKNFKEVFINASSRSAVSSIQLSSDFPVTPVRAIANKATTEFMELQKHIIEEKSNNRITIEEGRLEIERFWAGALKRAVIDGDVDRGSLMAGQSVGMVKKEQPAKDIINELIVQANEYLERLYLFVN